MSSAVASTSSAESPIAGPSSTSSETKPNVGGDVKKEEQQNGEPTAAAAGEDGDDDPNALPSDASETIYIHNLNETVKLDNLKQTLLNLFKPYKPLPTIIAHHNIRMRGQAFVSFQDKEAANRARKEVAGFPLYGRPMQVAFAKSRSDAVIRKFEDEDALEAHKRRRLEHKKATRRNNPVRQKFVAKHKAAMAADDPTGTGAPNDASASAAAASGPTKRAQLQMPDEYLPPNKVLFLQNLPEGTSKEDLQEVFEQHPNLLEVRLIPTRRDIAFVEYTDEDSAVVAKEALHNFKIDGETKMKVTYARK